MTLSELAAEVHKNTDAEKSATIVLAAIGDKLKSMASDPAAIQALADELVASRNPLSAAIVANTPADPNAIPPAG